MFYVVAKGGRWGVGRLRLILQKNKFEDLGECCEQ